MAYKPLLLALLLCVDIALSRPGEHPTLIDAQSTPTPIADATTPSSTEQPKIVSSTLPPALSRRANSKEIVRRITLGVNVTSVGTTAAATTTTTTPTSRFDDSDTMHMGVAVPVSAEEVDAVVKSTTTNDGLSTWILLSGGASSSTVAATTTTTAATSTTKSPRFRFDDVKVERKPQFKLRTTSTTEKSVESAEKPIIKATITKVASPQKQTPPLVRKKTKRPALLASTTTTTEAPATEPPVAEPTTSAPESTTFLIMEPKDADFDLPQDRSPGSTTKKPKRKTAAVKVTKTKKTKKTAVAKKPTKAPKEKPITTQIYNYLAREVMPTVGVGLVGLTVAAGLATYFLAPFGALRRSYDNASDRKDDIYFHNNEEYGGAAGQSEEEVFGKVIAGMPANSPYRNSIRYNMYRARPQQQPQPNVRVAHPPPHYRVRGPVYQPQPHPHPHQYMNTKRNDEQVSPNYRYNNIENVPYQRRSPATSPVAAADATESHSSIANTISITSSAPPSEAALEIITPEPSDSAQFGSPSDSDESDNNILKKRSKIVVVGSDAPVDNEMVPEHGPRRRRDTSSKEDLDNEIDSVLIPTTTAAPETTEKNSTSVELEVQPDRTSVLDLLRGIVEMKLRVGLSFLQQTTAKFQRYLTQVEKRVEDSKLFARRNYTPKPAAATKKD